MDGARYHNAWARKTYSGRVLLVTIGLGELMWSEEQAMSVSGHRSAEQMRRDYDYVIETTVASQVVQKPSENESALFEELGSISHEP